MRCSAHWRWAISDSTFPPRDPRWKDADSRAFLRHCLPWPRARLALGNADITVICERPKVGPHAQAMRELLAQDLAVSVEEVSVKATTSEKLGFTGRSEGIAAMAVCLLVRAERDRTCVQSGLPRAHGAAVLRAQMRTQPEDFFVEEVGRLRAHRQRRAPAADHREARHEHRLRRAAHRAMGRRGRCRDRLRRAQGPACRHPTALQRAPAEARFAGSDDAAGRRSG
jgi:hypothetical protein